MFVKQQLVGNKVERSIVYHGILGARSEPTKTNNKLALTRNGDSFLVNFRRSLFAIADSPDWNPDASRQFLEKFNTETERVFDDHSLTNIDRYATSKFVDLLIQNTNRLIEEVHFLSSTTFSCLFVIPDMSGIKGLILHCGDSCVFKVDLAQNSISKITFSNMNFVGRSDKLSEIKLIQIKKDTRFVLCTDGLQALVRRKPGSSLENILLTSFCFAEIHQIPNLLIDIFGQDIEFSDDVTIVALDPNEVPGDGDVLICN
jgi:serine/threonine protein phosphatase PrpC